MSFGAMALEITWCGTVQMALVIITYTNALNEGVLRKHGVSEL